MRHVPVIALIATLVLGQPSWANPLPTADTGMVIPIYSETTMAAPSAEGPPIARILQGSIGLAGTVAFLIAGSQMVGLRSVSGNTVNESYYQSMGVFSFGMAALSAWAAVDAFTDK